MANKIMKKAKNKGYINLENIKTRKELVKDWKAYISKAYGEGESFHRQIINKPFIGEVNSCCSQTYFLIGPFHKKTAENVVSYMRIKFFRFVVMLKKNSQYAMRGIYELVPLQDFSKRRTDIELYKKYNLTDEEIALIDSMIRPMDEQKVDETEE